MPAKAAREAREGGVRGRRAREAREGGARGRRAREAREGGVRGRRAREAREGGARGRRAGGGAMGLQFEYVGPKIDLATEAAAARLPVECRYSAQA